MKWFGMIFLLLILLTGCGVSPKVQESLFIDENFDFGTIKSVAVLPFENFSDSREAGEIIRQMVIHEIQSVVVARPAADVDKLLAQERINSPKEIDTALMKKIAQQLKVDALVTGVVYKYGETRFGPVPLPEVSINLKIIDPSSGMIVFSVVKSGSGGGFMAKHFGAGIEPISSVALRVVKEAVKSIYEK